MSVVIPILDGADTIRTLIDRLLPSLAACSSRAEVLLVDDGSTDATWAIIDELAAADPRIVGIRLARNCGQAAAIAAGFAHATGAVVATMDADLETYPEDVALLVDAIVAGADLASGRRTGPRGVLRGVPSKVFNLHVRRSGIALHDLGCGMNAMTAEVAAAYVAYGSIRRSLPKSLLVMLARRITEVPLRSVRSRTSRLRFADLAGFWFEFDALHRRFPGIAAATLGIVLAGLGLLVVAGTLLGPGSDATGWLLLGGLMVPTGVSLTGASIAVGIASRMLTSSGQPTFVVRQTTLPG